LEGKEIHLALCWRALVCRHGRWPSNFFFQSCTPPNFGKTTSAMTTLPTSWLQSNPIQNGQTRCPAAPAGTSRLTCLHSWWFHLNPLKMTQFKVLCAASSEAVSEAGEEAERQGPSVERCNWHAWDQNQVRSPVLQMIELMEKGFSEVEDHFNPECAANDHLT
jgi:hypothetical protein